MSTDENRFHALKFAAQTLPPGDPGEVIRAAQAYLHFLEGGPTAPPAAEDVELADLTESYPADEPVIAVADSPVEEELFGGVPEPTAEALATMQIVEDARAEVATFTTFPAVEAIVGGQPVYANPHADWLSLQPDYAREAEPTAELIAVIEAPTEAEITAAVEQIADPAPAIEDASEQPEMTDEQVERTEDHWRAAADQISAAEHEPEKELEAAGAYMRFKPWFSRS